MSSWQQRMWGELHFRPRSLPDGFDTTAEQAWLADFARRIECDGCRHHWRCLVRRYPPDLSSRAAYFLWTVRAHNEVNGQLGKPVFPFAAARRLYGNL